MKTLILLILSLIASLQAAPMELVGLDGRKIKAEIISEDGENVLIRKDDGKEYSVPVSRLTKVTRDAIAEELARIAKANAEELARIEAAKPKGMVLTSTIIKQVDGKFRYFFDFRNYDATPWTGSVEVTLLNKMAGLTNGKDVFKSTKPIEPKMGTFFYMDAHTGPESVHGDASVVGFRYVIIGADGKRSNPVEGAMTTKSEGF